jgi:subtilisin-like proprotein convertase family protein
VRRALVGLLVVAAVTAGLASGAGRAVNSVFPGSPFTFVDCCNNSGAVTGTASTSSSYPSTIVVSSGIPTVGHISVNVTLDANTPDDVELLLVSPSGAKVMLMSNAGGDNGNAITPDALVFDDGGGAIPDNSQLKDGTYHPTALNDAGDCDNQANPTSLPAPAPASPYATTLATFNGTVVTGQWKLFAVDDCNLGNVGGGVTAWSLSITGPTAVTVQSFTAKRSSKVVRLGWRTASEARIAGYNVYRFAHGTKVKVNRHFVAAKRSGTARGARYTLVDRYAKRAAVTYRLQIVSLSGKRSWAAAAAISARG